MNKELKFDHFKNIEELLEHIDIWYKEDDIDYTRWFHLEDLKKVKDYITNLQQEKDRLLNIARKMHEWIFLHISNEKVAFDELGLTDEENTMLGYGGQYIFKKKEVKNEKI